MSLIEKLPHWFQRRPLVLLSFAPGYHDEFLQGRHGLDRFTWAEKHYFCADLRLPTLCLVEMQSDNASTFYCGVLMRKAGVTTIESRLTATALQSVKLNSFLELKGGIPDERQRGSYQRAVEKLGTIVVLTPALSVATLNALVGNPYNKTTVEAVSGYLPGVRLNIERKWEQFDAIKTAMAAFGIAKSEVPKLIETRPESDSTLSRLRSGEVRVLEDNVIARDSSVFPGFHLIQKNITGRAVFSRGKEQLEIYTANRGALEEMLGVDLIYNNQTTGSIVMVQYKMLEYQRGAKDWVARYDSQFEKEVHRMLLPELQMEAEDYRLHRNPFFIKFVRRVGDGENHNSFVLSLDHFHKLIGSPAGKGRLGGVRISYDSLKGVYLRDSDFLGLVRSGYIGTHKKESLALGPIITKVAEGDRALVVAWQRLSPAKETMRF
jgi:hypothetical protein